MRAYMAEIYRLIDRQPEPVLYVSTSDLADLLNVSPPAVNRMVNKLKDLELLDHEPYQGIAITDSGRVEALKHIRYQRIAEAFLVKVMDINWLQVYDEAAKLSDGLSEIVVNRMYQMADQPDFCPHGEPIPTTDGKMPRVVDYPLTEVDPKTDYIISRVHTHDADKLKYFSELGLQPGKPFHLQLRAPFNGPLHLEVDGTTHFLGHELAGTLRVCSKKEYALV